MYIGRFAPTPSGPLHFGSLIAALGSYLQAKAHHGHWLVRIENLDPPREQPGASASILRTLERFHLHWDGPVIYQSERFSRYQDILNQLIQTGKTYACDCHRAQIMAAGGIYPGTCRNRQLTGLNTAIRLKVSPDSQSTFTDQLLGLITPQPALAHEDFILRRRDGLFAYTLAVVVDDADSGVTEIVRGADLLEPTIRQITLYHELGWTEPAWLHLPLAMQSNGLKLSKQNHAPSIESADVHATLCLALNFLGQSLPSNSQDYGIDELLQYAIQHWQTSQIPQLARTL